MKCWEKQMTADELKYAEAEYVSTVAWNLSEHTTTRIIK